MRLANRLISCLSVSVLAVAAVSAQDLPGSKDGAKVCVATVANASTTSAFVERLTDRLTKSLGENKLNAVILDSATTNEYPLRISNENGEKSKQKDCDYILLSQIRDPKQHPLEPRVPEIHIGGRVPSTDATDPMGGTHGSVYRANLQVAFALFKVGRFKPILDTYVLERPAKFVIDTLLLGMDHEADRVSGELRKKHGRAPE